MFQTKVVEKIKTDIFMSNNFFSPQNFAIYEIMCKNTVWPGRPQITIQRIHIANWLRKSANTHFKYV